MVVKNGLLGFVELTFTLEGEMVALIVLVAGEMPAVKETEPEKLFTSVTFSASDVSVVRWGTVSDETCKNVLKL